MWRIKRESYLSPPNVIVININISEVKKSKARQNNSIVIGMSKRPANIRKENKAEIVPVSEMIQYHWKFYF